MTNEKANGSVTTKTDKLPAMNLESLEKLAGVGLEQVTMDDLPTPRLKLLQTNSEEVDESNDKYVKGAKPGLILNTASNSVYGKDGINIVVCGYEKQWPEWREEDQVLQHLLIFILHRIDQRMQFVETMENLDCLMATT